MTGPTISIIGSGNIGAGVARMATAAGLSVVISNSRGPESLAELLVELGPTATAAAAGEVADHADLVVLAVPLAAYDALPAAKLADTVVVDTMNYYPDMFGRLAALDESGLTSSEFVQRHLPGARLVKALNNVDYLRLPRLARPHGHAERSALPVAGDDTAAVSDVVAFLDQIGFDALEVGSLADSWRFESQTPVHVAPYMRQPATPSEDQWQRFFEAETVPVPLSTARELISAARRTGTAG